MEKIILSEVSPETRYFKILDLFKNLKVGDMLHIKVDHEPISLLRYLSLKLGLLCSCESKEDNPDSWNVFLLKKGEEKEEKSVGGIVRKNWKTSEIFEKYDIDYCTEGF